MSVNYATEIDTATQAYLDNASYSTTGSQSEARLFVAACRKLCMLLNNSMSSGGQSVSKQIEEISKQQALAEKWLAGVDTTTTTGMGPRVTRADFRSLR